MDIIVTGASRGIGYEAVRLFAQDKDNKVIAVARGEEGLERLQKQCRSENGTDNVSVIPFDLLKGDYNEILLPLILKNTEKIDILLNNAGLMVNKPFKKMVSEDFDRVFGANVKSVFYLVGALLPYFKEKAHIVNIGSMGGFQGSVKFPGLSLYSASKGALAILTECLAEEFKDRKISVNCLALGSAQTEMLEEAFPGYRAPLSAAELAAFICDFAIHGHTWFNGKILPVSVATP